MSLVNPINNGVSNIFVYRENDRVNIHARSYRTEARFRLTNDEVIELIRSLNHHLISQKGKN